MTVWPHDANFSSPVPVFAVLEPKNGLIALFLGPILKISLVIFFRNFDPTQGLYRWKHYALRVGWHGLAQKFAKRPNLPKMPKSQKGALTKKRYFYFWIFGLNMAGRYARSILNWNLRVFYRFGELCQFWRFYLKVQFWAIPLPEIKFWGHFQIMNFWSSLSKSALKSWFRPKKTPKNTNFGFLTQFLRKNPKYAFLTIFFARKQLLRALLVNEH